MSLSASTLFAGAVKGQSNVTLLGEEAGEVGMAIADPYPDVVLPHTGLKVRLPLFRIVQYNHIAAEKGNGVMPDIYVPPTVENVRKDIDGKMKKVMEIIRQGKK